MIVATAGHVDHGKTSLIKALTGVDTDRLPEERARGMSIDLGFAYLRTAGRPTIAFIDVPGHERFVHNMIAGVHTLDAGLLVVAADDGPMPQTKEHLAILQALGAPELVVALTKVDRVDASRLAGAKRETQALLRTSHWPRSPIFAVAAPGGLGLEELGAHLHLLAKRPLARDRSGRFRMHVDRVFVLHGVGPVATGTVVSGVVKTGDTVWVCANGESGRIRSVHANDAPSDQACAGQRCALALSGVARESIRRGDVLTSHAAVPPSMSLLAALEPFDLEGFGARATRARNGYPVRLCLGTQSVTATLRLLGQTPTENDTGAWSNTHPLLASLRLSQPVVSWLGDRALVRDLAQNRLLGAATVLDPMPPQGLARNQVIERLAALQAMVQEKNPTALPTAIASNADPVRTLQTLLCVSGHCVSTRWLARACAAPPDSIEQALRTVACHLQAHGDETFALSGESLAKGCDQLLAFMREWHTVHPQALGPREIQIMRALRAWPGALLRAGLAQLCQTKTLSRDGPYFRLSTHRPRLTPEEHTVWQALCGLLEQTPGLRPPRVHELAQMLSLEPSRIQAVLLRASDAGLVYRVAPNRFFLPQTVVELGGLAEELCSQSPERAFTAAQYRNRSDLGRNLTIEVLEFLDRMGLTQRTGDARRMLGSPQDLAIQAGPDEPTGT